MITNELLEYAYILGATITLTFILLLIKITTNILMLWNWFWPWPSVFMPIEFVLFIFFVAYIFIISCAISLYIMKKIFNG